MDQKRLDLRARDLRRILAGASQADADGAIGPVQQALLHRRGWLRMLAPRSAGGFELALPEVVRLEERLAACDGSIGWTVTLCAGAGWFAGFLPPALAREIVGTRRVCVAGSGAPTGHADIDGDGFRLTGRWDYASGAPFATHFTLNAILREHGQVLLDAAGSPRIRAFIVPAGDVELVPSWRSIGLRATASHSYRIDHRWVGAAHGFQIDAAHATADGPLYRFPFMSLAYVTLAVNAAGMAGHFLELAAPCIARRKQPVSGIPLLEAPGVAGRVREAQANFNAARATFYRLLDQAWGEVLASRAPQTQALHAASLDLVGVARKAVDELYPFCGLYAASGDTEINRVWRDFHTATQHTLLLP
ncbi:acyl-CoA dehydrogenase [Massilia sp. R2A-15]|uniref:acyl-CoA dehydrogenase n=1 Tax=Massilia sp. R2A-15 TaxID=3064278 RepID=UPI002733832F|nr:acyl-CoA dehydrogenase [Massilia sp. R2A-15]WLI91321.1 acyl-CoA dehydrogenase [Massilia sp. R2A-15]